ncbi:MAG TPA: penicillin-binding protein 2 [Burkholderiaceae bacterium]|nr:penicillin-binding protein 2 [Burkholderiaceae bacterium]
MRQGAKGMGFTSSPVLAVRLPAWRSKLVSFGLTVMFVALLGRALWLQGVSHDFLQQQGASRYQRVLEMPAMRGKITDRNGVVVASSVQVKAIWAIPEDVDTKSPKIARLAKLLDMPEKELRRKLDQDDRKFVYLKRQVDMATAERIAALELQGIHQRREFRRYYPEAETFSHVLGFTNVEEVGQEGVELALERVLAGQPGSRRVIKDRLGRVIEESALLRAPVDGRDVALSIDAKIQSATYSALKAAVDQHHAKAGAAIVVDARTGEVLALANLPSYNPNQRTKLAGAQLRNRVITDLFEPGSTMKPFTAALAIETGRVTPNTVIQTAPGRLTIGTATISDAHPHGALTVAEVVQKSSNVGTTKMAMQMPAQQMWEMFTSVGFGQAPTFGGTITSPTEAPQLARLAFPGAASGRVRPYTSWRPIEQATMSYGYGISVSLAQLARAYTAFARDGDIAPLTLLKADAPAQGTRVMSSATAKVLRDMLEMATGPGGTAPKAQIIGYRVAGKTGTARKQENGGYADGKYIGSFAGFAPASDPRIVIAVMIDEPQGKYYGGDVAAPAFASIASAALRLLNVPPDAPFKTSITPAEGVQESL